MRTTALSHACINTLTSGNPRTPGATSGHASGCQQQNFGSNRRPYFLIFSGGISGVSKAIKALKAKINNNKIKWDKLHSWGNKAIRTNSPYSSLGTLASEMNKALSTKRFKLVDGNDLGMDNCKNVNGLLSKLNTWLYGLSSQPFNPITHHTCTNTRTHATNRITKQPNQNRPKNQPNDQLPSSTEYLHLIMCTMYHTSTLHLYVIMPPPLHSDKAYEVRSW